jgi:hypothetical protein
MASLAENSLRGACHSNVITKAALMSLNPIGKEFYVWPGVGDDTNDGTSPATALATLKAAHDLTTTGKHDIVYFIASATAYTPPTTNGLVWDHDYTHLIGLNSPLPGTGQRCRIVATTAADCVIPFTVSGTGCIIKNIQVNNEHATGTAVGSAYVSGLRNYFENCFFMNPTSTTLAGYALKVGSSENAFVNCSIGQATNPRAAATYSLWLIVGNTNKFIHCEFRSWSNSADHALVYVDATSSGSNWGAQFEDCLFENYGTSLTVAIDDNAPGTDHKIILRGDCAMSGVTAVSDPLTYVLRAHPGTGSGLKLISVDET